MVAGHRQPQRLPVALEARQRAVEPVERVAVTPGHAAVQPDVGFDDTAGGPVGGAQLLLQRVGTLRQAERLVDVAQVALHRGQVGGQRGQLGQVAQRLRVGDRPRQCRRGVAQASRGVQHVGVVGPEAALLLGIAFAFDEVPERLDDRQALDRAAALGQAHRMQPRRLETRPRLVETARQRTGLHGGGHPRGVVAGHQRGHRARGQGRGALAVAARLGQQGVDHLLRQRHALHDDQRLQAVAAGVERTFGVAGAVETQARLLPVFDLQAALRGRLRLARGLHVGFGGERPFVRAGPVRRDVRRLRLPRQQRGRDAPVQQPRDRRRHRSARGLADEVVREGAVADHLRRFEFTPGLGDVQRVRIQHRGGQLGAEAGAGQGRHARQLQRCRRQLRQAALDQCADGARLRQAVAGRGGAAEQHVLQGLEREHRVAAGVPQQRRGQAPGVDGRQCQRLDQLGQQRLVQRPQPHGFQALRFLQRRAQRRGRRAAIGRSLRVAPVQRRQGLGLR